MASPLKFRNSAFMEEVTSKIEVRIEGNWLRLLHRRPQHAHESQSKSEFKTDFQVFEDIDVGNAKKEKKTVKKGDGKVWNKQKG